MVSMNKILLLLFLSFSYLLHGQKIVFLGDSLTEGYQVAKKDSYPSLIEKMLKSEKKYKDLKIFNGGVSGSTTASGLKRLKWFLKSDPTHLVLSLGSNDGLRGFKVQETRKNLEAIIELAKSKGLIVILLGVKVPPNYGSKYQKEFDGIFPALAKKYKLPFMPFILEGVAAHPELNLADGIHPNPKGYQIIAKNILKILRQHL